MNIVITGASSGIGYQTALLLSELNHLVIAVSRNKEKLDQLKTDSQKRNPSAKLLIIPGDIAQQNVVAKITEAIKAKVDQIDILINNAGLLINKPFSELTSKDWRDSYDVNVFGTVHIIGELLPMMKPGSHIVNISSMGGFQGSVKFKGLSCYSSAKAALVNLTECLAEELKDRKIAVNCLCLGSVQTEMFATAFPSMKAVSSAEEIAQFIAQFAISGQHYFNGKIIPVSNSTP